MLQNNIISIILFSLGVFAAGATAINMLTGDSELEAAHIVVGGIGLVVSLGIWWMESAGQQYKSQGEGTLYNLYSLALGILSASLIIAMIVYLYFDPNSKATWEIYVAGGAGFGVLSIMAWITNSSRQDI